MKDLVAAAVNNANTLQGALEDIRANRLNRAMESLEQGLDVSVVMLKAICDAVEGADRERAMLALRWIRGYRRAHPRRPEADLSQFDKNVIADCFKLQDEARKILEGSVA